ncbi:MAG: phage portal protein [Alphaproteobacteria bacterium]|nr:phage portal protein [Alphaproteobacteria bacterium]
MDWPAFLTRKITPRKSVSHATVEQKASLSGSVVAYAQVGKPRWTPRRYDALAEEGFRKNVIAWRCISEVAKASASVPLLLYTEEHQELGQHPLIELLKHPNPLQSTSQFMESVYSYYNISGNVYIEAIRPEDGASPVELYVLRPDRMRVIPGESGLPQGYEYQVNGRTVRWAADPITGASNILHWKAFHPLDDWYGMAPLEAAMAAIDQHNSASAWNQALLNQAARPSGALIYSPKDGPSQLSDEQFRRLKEELEDHYLSPRNAGRPLILEGGLDWKEMGLTPKDMDWLAGRKRAAQDIALAFGVPDQLVGISEAQTFANMAEARYMLYEETVLPLVQQFKGALNRWLTPMFDNTLRLEIDVDEIPALATRRDMVWDKIGKADFLTRNEKREAVGYPPE